MTNWQNTVWTSKIITTLLILFIIFNTIGCITNLNQTQSIPSQSKSPDTVLPSSTTPKTNDTKNTPTKTDEKKLIIGILPDENPQKIRNKNKPLKTYLEDKLGREVKIFVPIDYASLIVAFENDKVDLAYFGGLSYLKAEERSGAIPLVSGKLEGTHLWNTTFIASTSTGINTLEEAVQNSDKYSIVFGDPSSTSGHLMPSYFLKHRFGIKENQFKNRRFTGTHTSTALTIANDKGDIGALNKRIFDEMVANEHIKSKNVKVIWITPGYADYVWAANPNTLSSDEINSIKNAFLSINDQDVLEVQRVEGYVELTRKDFSELRTAAKEMGMLDDSS